MPVVDARLDVDAAGGDAGVVGYPVYAGCEAPATTFARTLVVDPVAGSDTGDGSSTNPYRSLAAMLTAHVMRPGDHVIARAGDHGVLTAIKTRNPELDGSAWIWIDGQPGAVFQRLDLRDLSRWLVTGLDVTTTTGNLVSLVAGSELIVADNNLYTTLDTSAWTATDWISTAASAMAVRNSHCAAVVRNHIRNVRFGISVFTDAVPVPANQMNTLVADNEIRNFSADGIRPNASNLTVRNNRILDSFVTDAQGDGNHDDGIQGFALGGAIYDNVVIEGTYVQESTDPARAFNAPLQGISVFDGVYTHMHVSNNVVLVSAYHGISMYAAQDSIIERNTAIGIDTRYQCRISVPLGKLGEVPTGTIIRDNISNVVISDPAVVISNNFAVPFANAAATFVQFSPTTATYDLHVRPSSPVAGHGAGAY
jgi:Right handed beta helix region